MNEKKPGSPWAKSLLIWVGILFGLVLVVQMFEGPRANAGTAIPYSEFIQKIDDGAVRSVTMATNPSGNATISGKPRTTSCSSPHWADGGPTDLDNLALVRLSRGSREGQRSARGARALRGGRCASGELGLSQLEQVVHRADQVPFAVHGRQAA